MGAIQSSVIRSLRAAAKAFAVLTGGAYGTKISLHLIRCCLMLALAGSNAALAADQADVEATLQSYENAWGERDPRAIASFYHEPAMRISLSGPVVRQTRKDQEAFFSGFLPSLVQRGFDKGKWEELNVHLLDSETAVASGILIRTRKDGSVLERVAVSYGLRKTSQGWKIFLSDTHAPETVMRFR